MEKVEEKWPRGSFNKDLLLNTYFEHTDLFSPAANQKLKTGVYCDAPFKSKKYNIYWGEQKERIEYGYINPETKVEISGYHYFFLNFKQLPILSDPNSKTSKRITTFPRFWPIHYFFSQSIGEATAHGVHLSLLKPRGTGFSEWFSSMGARDFTIDKDNPSFFFVSNEGFLNKDGILSKAWDNLSFLNSETQRAFRHLRQEKNQDLHKKASFINPKTGDVIQTGGEIIGRVIDHPRKVRGARGYVYYEEGGSFPHLDKAWNSTRALVEQGGSTFGRIIAWGTGGEEGPGIVGLEDIFKNPQAYNCLEFDNCWDGDTVGAKPHGFFFPVWASMDRYMDKWGNTDFQAAKDHHDRERERIRKHSPAKEDDYVAEYPFTPSEALIRKSFNDFPIAELQRQLNYVDNSGEIDGLLKYGNLQVDEKGKVYFELDPKAKPINFYPHDKGADNLDSAICVLENPLTSQDGNVPDNLYQIIVDPFYKDDADDQTSLGAVYVYKKRNSLFPTEDDMFVAWYTGRPKTTTALHRIVFKLSRYYNARVQAEIGGGGQGLLDYARSNGYLQYCDFSPSMFTTNKERTHQRNRSYFLNITTDFKRELISRFADWLRRERALKVEGEKTEYILNLHKLYDRGLIEELIKFNESGNFDRISACLVLMAVLQEIEHQEIEERKSKQISFFDRPMFTDQYRTNEFSMDMKEMANGTTAKRLSEGESIKDGR